VTNPTPNRKRNPNQKYKQTIYLAIFFVNFTEDITNSIKLEAGVSEHVKPVSN